MPGYTREKAEKLLSEDEKERVTRNASLNSWNPYELYLRKHWIKKRSEASPSPAQEEQTEEPDEPQEEKTEEPEATDPGDGQSLLDLMAETFEPVKAKRRKV